MECLNKKYRVILATAINDLNNELIIKTLQNYSENEIKFVEICNYLAEVPSALENLYNSIKNEFEMIEEVIPVMVLSYTLGGMSNKTLEDITFDNVKDISISPTSPTIIIRKHAEQKNHLTVTDLLKNNQLSLEIINFLSTCIKGEANGIIVGITGSGKITFFRALFNYVLKNLTKKAFVVEDTPELFLDYDFMECLVTTKGDNPYTISDGIQDDLRSKPRYILVGEIRVTEATNFIEAAATGHSSWASSHSDTVQKMLNRLKLKYIEKLKVGPDEALEIICDSLDIIIILSNIPKVGRRPEIFYCYYDYENKCSGFKTIFEYNIENDTYIFKNGIPYKLAGLLRFRGATKEEILQYCYPEHEREEARKNFENNNTQKISKNDIENKITKFQSNTFIKNPVKEIDKKNEVLETANPFA